MITSWRITKARHAADAFTGEGARINGGRWHFVGTRVVYTSHTASLAALEILVHLGPEEDLHGYVMFACTFDESQVETVDRRRLPANWRSSPPPAQLQQIGDDWIRRGRSVALQVPSAIIETETNYLLNPEHAGFGRIQFAEPVPFSLDLRLLRRP